MHDSPGFLPDDFIARVYDIEPFIGWLVHAVSERARNRKRFKPPPQKV
jgi:hypothetical protein